MHENSKNAMTFCFRKSIKHSYKMGKYDDFALEWYSTIANTPIIKKVYLE